MHAIENALLIGVDLVDFHVKRPDLRPSQEDLVYEEGREEDY